MKKIHPEFAYQSRELAIQIEDTLGDPPNRTNYAKVVTSLQEEFANGFGIDDVNLLSFALVESLRFIDPVGLLAESQNYDDGEVDHVLKMVTCDESNAKNALTSVSESNPGLARKAIITAFLFKNSKRWSDEDHSLDALQKEENYEENNEDEDQLTPGHDIEHLFDANGDENE
ncbi:MAG: hypothetical protein Q8O24_00535 [Gallionellaceae bacterium]|nr:hypothetical protein [Gallionellaceae bacterium]